MGKREIEYRIYKMYIREYLHQWKLFLKYQLIFPSWKEAKVAVRGDLDRALEKFEKEMQSKVKK